MESCIFVENKKARLERGLVEKSEIYYLEWQTATFGPLKKGISTICALGS